MLILHHLTGNELTELQKFKLWNSAGAPTLGGSGSTRAGIVYYDSTGNRPYWYDGGASTWRSFSYGVVLSDIALTQNYLITGNGSNVASAITRASLLISELGAPTSDVAWNSRKITGLLDPTNPQDAATKNYVDNVAQGLDLKESCKWATTGNISLSGTSTQANGEWTGTLTGGERILVRAQTAPAENGIYVAAYGAWTRATDMDAWAEVPGAHTFVEQGATLADTGWVCTSDTGGTLGTTAITWSQFSSANSYTAGNGIAISGSTISWKVGGGSTWAAGDLYYGGSTTTISALAIGTSNRFLYSSGSAPAWSGYALPNPASTLTNSGILYASSTTQVSQITPANSSVLVTNGSGVPSLSTDLPTAVTIGTAYIYRVGGTDVSLNDGGTNASLTAVNGGLVYSTATALAITSAGVSGQFVRSGGAGAPTFYDLFGSSNSWTSLQTYNYSPASGAALGLISDNASSGSTADSPILRFQGNGNNGGTVTYQRWDFNVDITSTSGAGSLVLGFQKFTGAPGSNSVAVNFGDTAAADPITFEGYHTLRLKSGANYASITANGIGASYTYTLPSATGTFALTAGSTFTGASTWNGNVIGLTYGGSGKALTASNGGIVWTDADSMEVLAGTATARQLLWSGATATPAWSPYTMPATLSGANSLLLSSSSTALAELTPVADRVLITNGSSVVSWGGVLNVARNTSNGIARKWSNKVAGDGVNAYIDVTHTLSTSDVVVSVRLSSGTDTLPLEVVDTKVEVRSTTVVRLYFLATQTASDYYVVTIVG